ncbi:MAG TPA: hypothetical protein VKR42_01570 [Ktedonobacteraceae bacterium]|nr:hypothetical protein [Ktedonobacteraceae bacterium]
MHAHFNDPIWPTKTDYDRAFAHWQDTIIDRELRYGTLAEDKTGILQQARLDNHACLYRIDNWMVRCFCRTEDSEPPEDIAGRYELFSAFCSRNLSRVSALVPIKYILDGIKVEYYEEGTWTAFKENVRPLVKMPYVRGYSLGTFVAAHHQNSRVMAQLSDAWLLMINELEAVHMAHGDLDLTNVLVQYSEAAAQLQLKLIDYDNTWIPDFRNRTLPEHGHQHFQHPAFFGKDHAYNAEMDRFAALVIYISLRALSAAPDLYDEFEVNDEACLLFTSDDYKLEQHGEVGHVRQLQSRPIQGLDIYLDELCRSLHTGRMPRALSSIAHQDSSRRPVVEIVSEIPNRSSPLLEEGYEEVVWSDWDNIEYFQPGASQPSPAPAPQILRAQNERREEVWELPTRYVPPPASPAPAPRANVPQQQIVIGSAGMSDSVDASEMHYDPTVSANRYADYDNSQEMSQRIQRNRTGTSGRSTVVGCAVASAILLLVLLILLITVLNFIHH